jgi:hypothetical protein
MRYLFLLWGDETAELGLSDEERLAIVAAHGAFLRRVREGGREATGEPLGGSREAIVVRRSDGSATDGPFLETKELLGGFAVLNLTDMDEAIAMCRRYAAILGGTLEIDVRSADESDAAA